MTDTPGTDNARSATESAAIIRRIRYYIFVRRIPVFLALILFLTGCYDGSRPTHIGKAAPEFSVQDSTRKVDLRDFRGKILILNFWATWCPPCVEEIPSLAELQRRLGPKGVTVLGVSVDVDGSAYQHFLTDNKVDYLTVRDGAHKSSDLYGSFKFPETYIIDRNGILRRKFIGPVDWSSPEIVDFLTKLQNS